jgi:cbb3-type cytochrome oxidase cytochrome c subunit
MKGLQPLFLGIFGIFAFSWLGMTVVPNLQIGSLNPQTDEDGGDAYPVGPSGMALRGAQVYAANGCFYCHTQQVRPEYGGSDLERKWGERRSAPRDYIFEPLVMLGKMRTGPDLANVGHRAMSEEKGAATPPAPAAGAVPAAGAPAAATGASRAAAASPAGAANSTATTVAAPAAGAPAPSPPAGNPPDANVATAAPSLDAAAEELTPDGKLRPYTAAWHHRHLYNPRSVAEDSNMPPYRFLYEKRRIAGVASPDAISFTGDPRDEPKTGWEVVPSYDAKCLVAYLMTRDQSHPLKEAKAPATLAPAPAPTRSPASATEAKK